MTFSIPTPRHFNFWATVYSHGWCALAPFLVDKENETLRFVVPAGRKRFGSVTVREKDGILIGSTNGKKIHPGDVIPAIAAMLRMDESFEGFYALAKKYPRYRWVVKRKAGRLLRCATVFEDVVKMICTTNCSWALTEVMVNAFVSKLGEEVEENVRSFPVPEAIASCRESYLRREIRCGYRAPFLLEFARNVSEGRIDPERWRISDAPTGELFEEVRSVKGVGEYAAGNILKLLGRYDYLGLDSWSRGKFYEIHSGGRKVKDSTIEKHYAEFGSWRGLFLWMDMTKEWYEDKYPF